ncbi:hypothetical protein [Roseateles violae]|uniref:XRE family transcriptional regulator n=1 Tax=Roseateles violae TaxID=3058042 RepID=A0ABT8DXH0_9BURK|nr:hypothetical protein [Pelomonas sp. PFR6]MDN3921497.1 hypothetical protein [Pelomonas sp. PFR6]
MLSTVQLLDLAKEHQGGVTDYRISKLLGLKPQHVSGYRCNRNTPSNPVAMRLGELAGVDPVEAMAWVNLERASTDEERKAWELVLQRCARPAAS